MAKQGGNKVSTLVKFGDGVWDDDIDNIDCTPRERDQIKRYRAIFYELLERPFTPDVKIAEKMAEEYGVTLSQAYKDIGDMKNIIGNIHHARKEWHRHIVLTGLLQVIKKAESDGKLAEMTMALDKYAKYCRLDQDDEKSVPYDEIVPPTPNFINDPAVLGLPPMKNPYALVDSVLRKYVKEAAIPVPYEEVENGK